MRSTLNILIKRRKNKFKHSNFLKSLTLKKIMLPKEYSTLNFGNTFSEYLPCFNVSPSSLEILHTPSDFFEQIKVCYYYIIHLILSIIYLITKKGKNT